VNPVVVIASIKLNLCRRPLMHPHVAQACLDMRPHALCALVESGALAWAWDFGVGRNRKELRILAHCVVERASGPIPAIGATKNLKLPEVLGLVLPQKRETVRATELQRLFHASPDLIQDLGLAGEIKKVDEKLPAVGPNASPRYTCSSIAKFLAKRRAN
jgi:hypothetical protein